MWVSNVLYLMVFRVSIMSIACEFNDLGRFDRTAGGHFEKWLHGHQLRICDGLISSFVPKISINTSAKFGACITKWTIGLICWTMPPTNIYIYVGIVYAYAHILLSRFTTLWNVDAKQIIENILIYTALNACKIRPCKNEATCTDIPDGYKCTCKDNYSGTHCECKLNM